MRRIFKVLGFLLVVAVFGIGLLFFLPNERMARLLEGQIEAATGRQVTFEGDIKPSIYPQIGIATGPVTIANASWSDDGPILRAESLNVALDFRGLLRGDFLIGDITAVSPQVLLETSKDGQVNWSFLDKAETAPAGPTATDKPARKIALENLSLTGAAVRFVDRQTGSTVAVSDIDVALKAPELDGPLDFNITYRRGGDPLKLQGRLANTQSFLDGARTGVAAKLNAAGSSLSFNGQAAIDGSASGSFDVNIAKTSSFLTALGLTAVDLPKGFGRAGSARGQVTLGRDNNVVITGLSADLEGTAVRGDLAIALSARPVVAGSLTTSALDLSPFMSSGGGGTVGGGWSNTPIDASALSALDAKLNLSIPVIQANAIRLTDVDAALTIENSRAVLSLGQAEGFGGTVAGRFVANNRNGLSVSAKASANSIAIKSLLNTMAGYDKLSGTGQATVDVLGVGNSVQSIMSSLRGSGALALSGGEIQGLTLGALFLNTGQNGGSTVFDKLTGTYQIDQGVLKNSDLALSMPQLSATGKGQLNLGRQTLDYKITPILPKAADGRDLVFPVVIKGPWSNPKIEPQLDEAIKKTFEKEIKKEVDKVEERVRKEVQDEVQKKLGVTVEDGDNVEDVLRKKLEQELGNGLRNLFGGN